MGKVVNSNMPMDYFKVKLRLSGANKSYYAMKKIFRLKLLLC